MNLLNFTIDHYIAFIGTFLFIISLILVVKSNKFFQLIGIILIFGLTYYSKSQWCYLFWLIFIAIKTEIIDETSLNKLNIFKQAWNGEYKIEDMNKKEEKEKIQNDIKEEKLERKIKHKNYREVFQEYILNEKEIIDWFKENRLIFFEQNKKMSLKNGKILYIDGISETNNSIDFLEIKKVNSIAKNNYGNLLARGLNDFVLINNLNEITNKSLCYHLAYIFDSADKELEKFKEYINDKNIQLNSFQIYLFEQNENTINLVEKIDL